mgnify:CR=1 FL=1
MHILYHLPEERPVRLSPQPHSHCSSGVQNHARNPHGLCTHYEGVPLLHIHEMRSGSSCPESFGLWMSSSQNSFCPCKNIPNTFTIHLGGQKFHGSVKKTSSSADPDIRVHRSCTQRLPAHRKLISRILISSFTGTLCACFARINSAVFLALTSGLVMQRSKETLFLMLPLSSLQEGFHFQQAGYPPRPVPYDACSTRSRRVSQYIISSASQLDSQCCQTIQDFLHGRCDFSLFQRFFS